VYKILSGRIANRNSTHLEEQSLLLAEQRDFTLEVNLQGSVNDMKGKICGLQEKKQEFNYRRDLLPESIC